MEKKDYLVYFLKTKEKQESENMETFCLSAGCIGITGHLKLGNL